MAKKDRNTGRPKVGRPLADTAAFAGPVVTRAEAMAGALKRYFLNTPCAHGHIAQRQTSNKECITCGLLRGRRRIYSEGEYKHRKARRETNRSRINEYRRSIVVQARAKRRLIVQRWAESEKGQKWLADYAAKKRAIVRNRRAKQRASVGQHTAEDVDAILKLQRGKCAYCQKAVGKKYHVDHIVSVAKGGGNDRRNLQITCAFCNVSKGERDPIDHAKRIGLLI